MSIIDGTDQLTNLNYFLSLIDEPATNEDIELQLWVIKNLSKYRTKESINYLIESLKHKNSDVRIEAIKSLEVVGITNEALHALQYRAKNDLSLSVRRVAETVLKKYESAR